MESWSQHQNNMGPQTCTSVTKGFLECLSELIKDQLQLSPPHSPGTSTLHQALWSRSLFCRAHDHNTWTRLDPSGGCPSILVHGCCPGDIVNSTPFYFQKCPALYNKLYVLPLPNAQGLQWYEARRPLWILLENLPSSAICAPQHFIEWQRNPIWPKLTKEGGVYWVS